MTNIIPLLSSLETLLVDVRDVRSSELSLRQLAVLIDEEFGVESKHMVGRDVGGLKQRQKSGSLGKSIFSFLFTVTKWIIGFMFLFTLSVVLIPEKTANSLNSLHAFLLPDAYEDPGYASVEVGYNSSSINIEWYFYTLQLIRWSSTSLKIERKFPITDHDMEACIVNNPMFREQAKKCSSCQKVTGFDYNIIDVNIDKPLVIENQSVRFNMGRLQQILHKNKVMVNQHTVLISSNCEYVNTVEDLKNNRVLEQLGQDNVSHIIGTSVSYMASHILRKEFLMPQDYFTNAAQTYKTYLYIDGKNSPSFTLKTTFSDSNFMYVQCQGSRRLVFSPPAHCQHSCRSFSRIMNAGDIVFYSNMWTVHTEPSKDSSLSLSYVDNYEWFD